MHFLNLTKMQASLYRSVNFMKTKNNVLNNFIRCLHVDVSKYKDSKPETVSKSSSSGDLFKRPVRGEPGKVKHGFLPMEWFDYFTPKTGVTGFYTFIFTTTTYLASKEILIMEHNFYNGLSMMALCILATKNLGAGVAKYIDRTIEEYEATISKSRTDKKKALEDAVEHEKKLQWSCEGQQLLVEAKRENVHLQREAEFRKRLMVVYEEVKKRLDCQVAVSGVEGKFVHKNIVEYVINGVNKSLTPEFLNKYMDRCLEDFAAIAAKKSK